MLYSDWYDGSDYENPGDVQAAAATKEKKKKSNSSISDLFRMINYSKQNLPIRMGGWLGDYHTLVKNQHYGGLAFHDVSWFPVKGTKPPTT